MLAFVHLRRTTGRTIESILSNSFGLRHCPIRLPGSRGPMAVVSAAEVTRLGRLFPPLASVSGHGIVPYGDLHQVFPQARYFTFLREPIERCAADFAAQVVRREIPNDFAAWLASPQARNRQTRQLCGAEDASAAIRMIDTCMGFVGLAEQLDTSLVMFRRWVHHERTDIRYSRSQDAAYQAIMGPLLRNLEMRRRLIEANRQDLAVYAHVVETVFPRQVTDYGRRLESDVETFVAFNHPAANGLRCLGRRLYRKFVARPAAYFLVDRTNPDFGTPARMKHPPLHVDREAA